MAAPPLRDGVGASRVQLPPGAWSSVFAFLLERFPAISADIWRSRLARGLVLDASGGPIDEQTPYRAGSELRYYRELPPEPRIPFEAEILHRDAHLLVVDKPHFLPVLPTGRFVQESLLVRLKQRLALDDLVPLHRLDRGTAGIVLFSIDPASRGAYQHLFARREMEKAYEALAPHCDALAQPRVHRSRIGKGEPFFRMKEIAGEPNSETRIALIERRGDHSVYRLEPVTGRKHQLRVHLAALGAPILNDPWYPELREEAEDDYTRPLKLLARAIAFIDPLSGAQRRFESARTL